MSHYDYLKRAIADLKQQTGLPVTREPAHIGTNRPYIFLGIEGAFLLNETRPSGQTMPAPQPEDLERLLLELRSAGLSYVGLTWSNQNPYAGVAGEEQGLTAAGRELVRLLLDLGLLIDLSHSSDQTVRDVFAMTEGRVPLFFSHSSVRELCDHPRNLSDELLDLTARSGGVVGINFHALYLTCGETARRADVLRHIDSIARRYGDETVALGGDFDGLIQLPEGLGGPPDLKHLAAELRTAGYGRDAIERIYYQNVQRVLTAAQRRARR